MPIYEYKCNEHGNFEIAQAMFEEHTAECPVCDKPMQRVFSKLNWIWAGSAYRQDGSLREDNDYASVMRG